MKVDIRDDHIGVFDKALPEDLIDNYLDFYKENEKQGVVYPRASPSHQIEDNQLDLITNTFNMNVPYNSGPFLKIFFKDI